MQHSDNNSLRGACTTLAGGILWLLWQAIRWPVLALLIVLEPVVRFVLCGFALLGTLTALMLRFTVDRPQFPFWGMLGVSLSCVALQMLYYAAIRLFSQAQEPPADNRYAWAQEDLWRQMLGPCGGRMVSDDSKPGRPRRRMRKA